jgi:sugar diacid utilization regulator
MATRFAIVKHIMRVTATAHQRIELLTARETYERRALALRTLLRGSLGPEEVREHAANLGLDANRSYVAVRARARGRLDSDQVQRLLAGRHNHPPYASFALSGDDVVGLLAEAPSGTGAVTIGVSGAVPLESVARAAQEAQLAFATAWSLGLTGAFTTGDLGLRAAVQQLPEMSQALRDKYMAPLLGSGSLGNELLLTVRAYLEGGSRREAAATKLHVHLNTVGYRIGRFCELTGADLTDFTTLAELWWLFTDLDLRPVS